MKTWSAEAGLRLARLVDRPSQFGGGQVILLGCTSAQTSLLPGSLCAFDADGDLITPLWRRRVETQDVLPELRSFRGATGGQFTIVNAWLMDVFPESEYPKHPGPELVVWFVRWYYSQSVVRIYDLRGELLYQVWHDGIAYSCHWMSDAKLLVFAGNCHWPYHDNYGKLLGTHVYDFVVFALRPQPGYVAHGYLDYLRCKPGDERLDPAWYLRLLPVIAPDFASRITLRPPFPPNDPRRSVAFHVALNQPIRGSIIAAVDEHGEEIPGSRIVGDSYKRNQNLADDNPDKLHLPDPDEFRLAPLTMDDVMPASAYNSPDATVDRP